MAGRPRILQRYTVQDIPELKGTGKLSQNRDFFLPDSYGGQLVFGASPPLNSERYKGEAEVAWNGKTYVPYISKSKFYRDCLHTAEEIIHQKELEPGIGVNSRITVSNRPFGETARKNITAARSNPLDDGANPGLNQAYLIVNTKWPKGGCDSPYHAAAVVAVDGNDRLTLEVFANSSDAKKRNVNANYGMYTTGASGEKFHSYWQANYFTADSVTTVIESI